MKAKKTNVSIAIENIKPNIKNPRKGLYHKADIEDLAENMQSLGQITPIKVLKQGQYYTLLAGHRRYMAARSLQWDTLRADVYESLSAFQQSSILFSDNATHKKFNAWEMRQSIYDTYWNEFVEEYTFKSDNDKGYSEFAKSLGIHPSWAGRIIESMSKKNQLWINKVKNANLGTDVVDAIMKRKEKYRSDLASDVIEYKKTHKGKGERATDYIKRRYVKIKTEDQANTDELPPSYVSNIIFMLERVLDSLPKKIIKKLDATQKAKIKELIGKIKKLEL